ncbi:ty3-gypsy retrotransposon protein [Tanacetum coccineum]
MPVRWGLQPRSTPINLLCYPHQHNQERLLLNHLPLSGFCPPSDRNALPRGYALTATINGPGVINARQNFLLLLTEDEADGEADTDPTTDAVKSGYISIFNLLMGQGSPRSLQLWGSIGSGNFHVLIDNGSTYNFVHPDIVEKMQLPVQTTKAFKVYIESEETLLCEKLCTQVKLGMQGLAIEVDLYVLPMQGPDVVLGIQWLQKLGKVTHDYALQTMEFTLASTTYTLKGDESLRMKRISLNHMHALLDSDDVYGVYELHHLSTDDGVASTVEAGTTHPDLEQLLVCFDSLFQVPTSLPPHRVIDHRIHLLPNTKPVNVKPYRYPHYQKGEMERLVKEMLDQGIIQFSQSPFSSPVLLVKKKDGSYRFCVDYRALNEVTVKDKFPIPTADEMFDELGGAVIFTKLDLRAGYHQIRVHDRDVYKTAFRTHDGHYEFLVMPFGLTNAPSTFQATMNRLFSPYLRKFVIVFFDDILIYSASLTAHMEHLECVLSCLQAHQFYVKRSKCAFGASTLEYLGHIISGVGVEVDPKKIAAVSEWPTPKTQRQVRGFLGLAGYYRRFIKGYAAMAAPLTDLLRKDGFRWGEAEAAAFESLKLQLTTTPVLTLPNFDQTFIVETDAADAGIGAVLLQNDRPICYFSRRLGPRMQVAATYQKELFAIVEAVFKWRQYLLGRRFVIQTDHRSIKELLQQVIQTPIQQKYVWKLLGFDFSIEYKPGAQNTVADAFSRVFEDSNSLTASFMHLSQPLTAFLSNLKAENSTLADLVTIHRQLDTGTAAFHDTPSSGHEGAKKMMVGLSAVFYWKGMRKAVEAYVKQCRVCQQTKYSTQAIGGYLQPLATPTAVWEDLSMDFITGMPVSKGLTVVIVVVDRFSKYAHFAPLPTSFNAHKVAEVFVDTVIKLHGIPKTIVLDRDPIFVSNFWTQPFKLSGTQLNHSTAYHPQSDGQTEVVNRGLEQYLRAMAMDHPTRWVRFLPWAEYCYNTTYHSSIKMTPYQCNTPQKSGQRSGMGGSPAGIHGLFSGRYCGLAGRMVTLRVSTAGAKGVTTGTLVRLRRLINRYWEIVSLISLSRGSFDVTVGMDWLSKRKFVIVCYEKVVRIPLKGDEIFRVHGERTLGATKALMNAKVDEPRISDIPVARDITDVFLEDLSMTTMTTSYHQLRVHEDAIPKTTFQTRYRHFESTVMPFGLTNAPAVFMDLMNRVYKPYLGRFVIIFIGDIMAYSRSKEEHEVHLKLVLESLRKEKLYAKFSKSNVMGDALSRKERMKSRRVRGMILTAQSEAFKQENVLTERLHGLEQQMERKGDENLYFMDRIWVLLVGNVMDEAHASSKEWNSGDDQLRLRWMIYLVVLADAVESVRDAIGFEYCLESSNGWTKGTYDLDFGGHNKGMSPVLWAKSRESSLIGPELVLETIDKVVLIKEKLKVARDRQKSYVDFRRKPLESEVGDCVLLKVSPWKGIVRLGKKGKLAPRYVGSFEILKRTGLVDYRLRLPEELIGAHDTFHVSNLKKCLGNANLRVSLNEIKIDKTLLFVEEPVEIIGHEIKSLKHSRIPLVKVCWNSKRSPKFTWKCKDHMKSKYPQLFVDRADESASQISRRDFLKEVIL